MSKNKLGHMNIYLDIDGVLLADVRTPSRYANEFIQAAVTKYPDSTYWLTTHVWRGEHVISYSLAPYVQPETQALLEKIKPTEWDEYKTDGIDFTQPFLWFDDDLFDEERNVLEERNALDSHVMVDLASNPDQLRELIAKYFS